MTSPALTSPRSRSAIPSGWTTDAWGHPRPPRGSQIPELERLWELRGGLYGTAIQRYDLSEIEAVCIALREAAGVPTGTVFDMEMPAGRVGTIVPGQRNSDLNACRVRRPGMAKRLLVDEAGTLAITLSRDGVRSLPALQRALALLEPLVHPVLR